MIEARHKNTHLEEEIQIVRLKKKTITTGK